MQMNISLTIIFNFIFCLSAIAQEQCAQPALEISNKNVDALATKVAVIAGEATNDSQTIVESAKIYLFSIGTSTDFDENEARGFVLKLTPICEDNKLEAQFRSSACTRLAGLDGKLAQKLQMSGISNGKDAFKYLKVALALDDKNKDAILGHARVIYEVYNKGFLIRKMVESNLNTSFKDEANVAKSNLEKINLTDDPAYKKILDII